MIRKIIKQWLCEHKKTEMFKRVLTTEDDGSGNESQTLSGKIWFKCPDCNKITTHKWKWGK